MSNSLRPHELQHTWPPCPSQSLRVCSDSCPLSQWCHPTIPFSSCPQSLSALGSFPKSHPFASGGQSNVDSASVLPMNIQGWISLGLTGLISLQSKGFSRVRSGTTILPHTLTYFFFKRMFPYPFCMSVCAGAILIPFDIFTANAVHICGLRNGAQKITFMVRYRADTGLDPSRNPSHGTAVGAQEQHLGEGSIHPLQRFGSDFLLQVESACSKRKLWCKHICSKLTSFALLAGMRPGVTDRNQGKTSKPLCMWQMPSPPHHPHYWPRTLTRVVQIADTKSNLAAFFSTSFYSFFLALEFIISFFGRTCVFPVQ